MKISIKKITECNNDIYFQAYDEKNKYIKDSTVYKSSLRTEEDCIEMCIDRAKKKTTIELIKTIEI